jgi:23S rRNA pseudouridine2605 synthase
MLRLDGVPLPPLSAASPLLGGLAALYAFNKPRGVLTAWRDHARAPASRPTLTDALSLRGPPPPAVPKLMHAGRLDFDSEGLLLLTTCGELAQRATHPSLGAVKRYVVVAAPAGNSLRCCPVTSLPQALRAGVELAPEAGEGAPAGGAVEAPRPAAATAAVLLEWPAAEGTFSRCGAGALGDPRGAAAVALTLSDGRKRVVRRMFAFLGWRVERLLRVAVGGVELGALPAGGWVQVPIDDFFGGAWK